MTPFKVLYTAAHGGAGPEVPIGGGGAICRLLSQVWQHTRPFDFEVIRPTHHAAQDLVRFSQSAYADFCHQFREQCTQRILAEDPTTTRVLVNDISEGPEFRLLAQRGYRLTTIWHVDVLAYVARIYLRGALSPQVLSRIAQPMEPLLPATAKLVFTQQRQCVEHSAAHIVMTEEMRRTITSCYGPHHAERIHVIAWGTPPFTQVGVRRASSEPTLLMLSRISPEKGQHRVLEALVEWQRPARLVIAGEAAFMEGRRYLDHLKRLAAKLKHQHVEFAGHLTGQAKADAFASADLYLFPSIHESYGLTMMEALAHGLPVVATNHAAARATLQPEFSRIVDSPRNLPATLDSLLNSPATLAAMSKAAQAFASQHPFQRAAERVAHTIAAL